MVVNLICVMSPHMVVAKVVVEVDTHHRHQW
jgi:hypothetical protein